MKAALRDARQLCRALDLPEALVEAAQTGSQAFSVFAPLGYVAKMERRNPNDPLLRQVLPLGDEAVQQRGFTTDPVGDLAAASAPGLLHKYSGRVLLIATGTCAVHCRYCFRRHFPYSESPRSLAAWQPALRQIAEDQSIEEVILSGGDPLTLTDSQLKELVEALAAIGHVRRLRVHSRVPIVIPERVTEGLLHLLRGTRLTPLMVVHANHPREVLGDVGEAVSRCVAAGIPTLNQAVLLRGVNDDVQTLCELSEQLINTGVMPYYLHQLDRVTGASHFEVPISRGRELLRQMRARLPGYAVPRYVQEIAGERGKSLLE